MESNYSKGKRLEKSVEIIESLILHTQPSFKNSYIKIERNKILNHKGVHHEIDLFINVDKGFGYNAIYIFECKNQDSKSVDKNDILIFSEKIDISSAQFGFFIARSYSKDAENQALLDKRIKLLKLNDFDFDLSVFPEFSSLYRVRRKEEIKCILNPSDLTENSDFDENSEDYEKIDLTLIKVEGRDIDFKSYIFEISDSIIEKELHISKTKFLPPGLHKRSDEFEVKLENNLLYSNRVYDSIKMTIDYEFVIGKPNIISTFDIQNRGKIIGLEFTFTEGKQVIAYIVKLDDLISPNSAPKVRSTHH